MFYYIKIVFRSICYYLNNARDSFEIKLIITDLILIVTINNNNNSNVEYSTTKNAKFSGREDGV